MGMIINPYVFGTAYDADAQAFFTAAGITDTTQKDAVNQLVLDLKSYSIWTKMKALYPFVGGTASTHKWNLKDPRDLDAAFRLVFSGGWTHSNTGALPNGSNGYADTKLDVSTNLGQNSTHISYYSRTNIIGNTATVDMGCANGASGTGSRVYIITSYSGGTFASVNSNTDYSVTALTDTRVFVLNNRNSSSSFLYQHNTIQQTVTSTSTGMPDKNIYIGAFNRNGTVDNYAARECAFASIGDGLTDTEATNFYTAVQAFQTTLGRNV